MALAFAQPADPMPEEHGYTVEDWLALPEGKRVELIGGSFVMSPIAAYNHLLCTKRLVRIFDDAVPYGFEVTEGGNVPCLDEGAIPDIVVGDAELMLRGVSALPPEHIHLVVEVVSPGWGNRQRDYVAKPRMYAKAGIPTFLRVELTGEGAPTVEVLILRSGKYERDALVHAGEMVELKEPFEVSFDPAVLAGPRQYGSK